MQQSPQKEPRAGVTVAPGPLQESDPIRALLRTMMDPSPRSGTDPGDARLGTGSKWCRVVILEDDQNLAELLTDYLSALPDFEIPKVYSEGESATRVILAEQPQVALIDLRLGGESGLDCLRTLRKQGVSTRLIAFTSLDDEATILEAFRAGADGYLVKQQSLKALAESLINCARGRPLVSDAALAALVKSFRSADTSGRLERLTPKERAVLDLTDKGHSCKEIAELLGMSLNTVYVHNKRILRKLKVGNRYAATFMLRGPA